MSIMIFGCVDSVLDLFTPPFKQLGVIDDKWIEVRPC